MSAQPQTPVPLVFGAMTFGAVGKDGVRTSSVDDANAILDVFQAHGHNEIDSARIYGAGTSEEYLQKTKWQDRGLVMATKVLRTAGRDVGGAADRPELLYTFRPHDLRRALLGSLAALGAVKIDIWYLHAPDRESPLEDTLREINTLHQEGRFARFGLSNYMSWEVAQICELCDRHGWVRPSVYQGLYNAVCRVIEPELLPCLRHYGIALYAFQPLAGGFLTSRYRRGMDDAEYEKGARFDADKWQGSLHRALYWKNAYFDALEDVVRPAARKHKLTEAECALRWAMHHGVLEAAKGDKLIIGASSLSHLESNLADLEKGPLPEEVVRALDEAWAKVKGVAGAYYY